jgi:hypothetical protein
MAQASHLFGPMIARFSPRCLRSRICDRLLASPSSMSARSSDETLRKKGCPASQTIKIYHALVITSRIKNAKIILTF